jgi:hypothetical protein
VFGGLAFLLDGTMACGCKATTWSCGVATDAAEAALAERAPGHST